MLISLVDLLVNVMDMALVWDVLISGNPAEGLVANWCSTVRDMNFCCTITNNFASQTATMGAGVIAFIVQLFYAYRLWIRKGSLLLGSLDCLLTGTPKLVKGTPGFRESL